MLLYIIIIIAVILADQGSKAAAVAGLSGVTTVPIIPNVFHLTYVQNTGAAFSLFSDMQLFLIIMTVIFTCVLCYVLYILPKTRQYFTANLGLSLMIGGAIGNLIDRIRLAYVIDFFDFRIIGFAIFNVADIFVVIGTFILAYSLLKDKTKITSRKKKKHSKPNPENVSATETAEHSMHKDVLKNLKPEPPSEPQTDITPEVHTDIIRLPDRKPIEFEPSPSLIMTDPEIEDPPVKIYHPRHSRVEGDDSNTDVISVAQIRQQLLDSNEEVVIKTSNRYSERSKQYEASVNKQRENTRPLADENNRRNRYRQNVDHYAETVSRNRRNNKRTEKSQHSWNPQTETPARRKKKTPSAWDTGEIAMPHHKQAGRDRYSNILDSYEASIESGRRNKKTGSFSQTPEWEPTDNRDRAAQKAGKGEERSNESENVSRRNRYTDRTDSYIESIKRASEKHYTSED